MPARFVLIPEERKAILIGRDGRTKEAIERLTGARMKIGDGIEIEGEAEAVMKAHDIAVAIGRGFPPKDAMLLAQEKYGLEVLTLGGETKNGQKRIMARVIGRGGSSRGTIEQETGARIRVYGKTIAIIGNEEELARAREAITLLVKGKSHGFVFSRLKG